MLGYDWYMPLSATVDGDLVCGPLLDESAWSRLRGRPILLQPCGHRGFTRVSKLGTRHFVHERDCDCHAPESSEHLHVKALVAQAVARVGWAAATEVPGPGFVADVLADSGDARVAFEVQKSRQVLREYERRQATYESAGVRCVWLVDHVPAGHQASAGLPLFKLADWLGSPRAVVSGRTLPLAELVAALLAGTCRWRGTVTGHHVTVETITVLCPMCGVSREAEVSRWIHAGCHCGLPVISSSVVDPLPARGRCCGYWGPGLVLRRTTRSGRIERDVPAGHWCVSASAHRRARARPA